MDDVFVGSLMSSPVYTTTDDTPLRDAGELMLEHGIGSIVVVDDEDHIEGILTATDFVRVVAEDAATSDATVASAMSRDVTTAGAEETIQAVADLMVEHGFHHVPVVDDEAVIGVITTTDLTGYLSSRQAPSPT